MISGITSSIEDYLKAIFQLSSEDEENKVGTNQLAEYLEVKPASVSVMLKKLRTKGLVSYEKYGRIGLTAKGSDIAVSLVRRHRLWETFLYQKLNFSWDEVHKVAHELEHIQSSKLIQELDKLLGYPSHDPHGHIIPDANGRFVKDERYLLADLEEGQKCRLESVRDSSAKFLKYVTQLGLALSTEIEIREVREFDGSLLLAYDGQTESVSRKFAENIFVKIL
jgi:DtxR family Mn-dependent transcriptional regulator